MAFKAKLQNVGKHSNRSSKEQINPSLKKLTQHNSDEPLASDRGDYFASSPHVILRLQRSIGNQAVNKLLAEQEHNDLRRTRTKPEADSLLYPSLSEQGFEKSQRRVNQADINSGPHIQRDVDYFGGMSGNFAADVRMVLLGAIRKAGGGLDKFYTMAENSPNTHLAFNTHNSSDEFDPAGATLVFVQLSTVSDYVPLPQFIP